MNAAAIEQWLTETIGLDPASMGQGVVARAAEERMHALGCATPEAYAGVLRDSAAEQRELIERVVVPETWFFRDRPALDALARHVLATWAPAHPGQTFRVLSVPCATGEEPYSIAMALVLAGWPLERLRIDAVDISLAALTRAATGVYRRNSFRGDDLLFRDRFFSADGPDAWRLNDGLAAAVHFAPGNLLAPTFAEDRERYDAICCRNLLIYFDGPSRLRALRTLATLLTADGWLVLGPAEAAEVMEQGFEPATDTVSAVLRRRSDSAAPRAARRVEPAPAARGSVRRGRAEAAARGRDARPKPPVRRDAPAVDVAEELAAIRALADADRMRDAAERAEAVLGGGSGSPDLLYLAALTQDACGNTERAEHLYRKLLYLEPQHADALLHLALLMEKRGQAADAERLRARARRHAAADQR